MDQKRVLYDPFLPPLRLSTGGEKVGSLVGGVTESTGAGPEWASGVELRAGEASLGEEVYPWREATYTRK